MLLIKFNVFLMLILTNCLSFKVNFKDSILSVQRFLTFLRSFFFELKFIFSKFISFPLILQFF